MSKSRMQPETLDDQFERMKKLSEAERRGAAAASEGQLTATRVYPASGDDLGRAEVESHQTARLRVSSQDVRAEEPKKAKSGGAKD